MERMSVSCVTFALAFKVSVFSQSEVILINFPITDIWINKIGFKIEQALKTDFKDQDKVRVKTTNACSNIMIDGWSSGEAGSRILFSPD